MLRHSLSVGTGKSGEVAAVNCGGWTWHSGERRGSGSQSRWAANPSEAMRWQLPTTLTHNRYLVDAPG